MNTSSNSGFALFKSLADVLNQSQESVAGHAKLLAKCHKIYNESKLDEFIMAFTKIMQQIMISMQKNPNIDRTIDFIAKFACSLSDSSRSKANGAMDVTVVNNRSSHEATKSNTTIGQRAAAAIDQGDDHDDLTAVERDDDDEENDLENYFLVALIDFLIDNHRSNSDAVRYRCCNILAKLMSAINNDQFIDEDLYDRLCDAMMERLRDINSKVQVQAISAIYRLQDPNDRECRVTRALTFLMTHDPHWQVRYQALANIAFSRTTLPDIIDRVRDPNPNVRRKSLLILSEKVLIKFINIERRLFILNYSLKDDDPGVVETCCKKLLPSWLAFKENDICKLLKALDVVQATDTMKLMLKKMYASHTVDSLIGDFHAAHMDEKHVIPAEKLDAENVFYWWWLCDKCKTNPNKKQENNSSSATTAAAAAAAVENTSRSQNEQPREQAITFTESNSETGADQDKQSKESIDEDNLDNLLPSLTEFCDYLCQVLKRYELERIQKCNDERLQIENTFIIKTLLSMFDFIDFSDVHGK
jgi:hypothetical protein